MVNYEYVLQGLVEFVDNELTPKLSGVNRWLFGTGVGIALKKGDKIFNELKEIPMLKTLDIIEDNKVNVDLIYSELLKQADKSPINIDIKYLGSFKLTREDVERIYQYIKKKAEVTV